MTAIAKLILISILSVSLAAVADEGSGISDIREAKTGNPIIELHPSANQEATQAFYLAVEKNVFNGAIPLKYAQLAAISASAIIRCEYCIPAHTAMAKAAGASDEEIKTALAIAADVALNSTMLYGNQFDMDDFMEMFPQ
ncbi:MAG: carboxymuconolactone decarboxylase family protein [Opitutae bacterium]|jgi:AhpD family alkylhydroperoxidase